MYIPSDDTEYYHFCRLQSVVEMCGHPTLNLNKKFPKLLSQRMRKLYYFGGNKFADFIQKKGTDGEI